MSGSRDEVVVVLGCRVREHRPSGALTRRLARAATLSRTRPELPVILSGGRKWDGTSESQAMSVWWSREGTDAPVVLEDDSLTTLGNARCVARLCAEHGYHCVHLVTCDFHMKRATRLFRKMGLSVISHPAPSPRRPWLRFRLAIREWGARCLSPFESLIK